MNATSTLATELADLRKSYEKAELDERSCLADPLKQFQAWLQQALDAKLPEPNAMTLATVGADGRPSTRVVLIKGLDERGVVWYTNYQSRKGVELAHNPYAALQFHWVELERVVRIEGLVEKVEASLSDTYFATRPALSRVAAAASPQSQPVSSRAALEQAMQAVQNQHGDHPPRPLHWGGYRLKPDRWEFWQGRRNRLHDRLRFRLDDQGGWIRERLAP